MPNRVLVTYASKHGSTREIADAIAEQLWLHQLRVDTRPADEVESLEPYIGVVLGSAVYMGHWRRPAVRFLKRHRESLRDRALWVFSSGPLDPADRHDHTPGRARHLAESAGARELRTFAGRLPDDPANVVERSMVKTTPEAQRDVRDWAEIRAWGDDIAGTLVKMRAPRPVGSPQR